MSRYHAPLRPQRTDTPLVRALKLVSLALVILIAGTVYELVVLVGR